MKKTWLLGFGFFSISLGWSLYNAFVPFFLDHFLASTAIIGFLMTIDNYFALFLQPYIGQRSDRTKTRFGRRMPYLLIGIPIAAIFYALIPFHTSLFTLLIFMVCMNLSMAIFRSPTIALMPDITPESKQTKANGIINFMGGCGAILAFSVGSILFNMNESLPFLTVSAVFFVALWVVFKNINENRDTISYSTTTPSKINYKKELNSQTLLLLAAIFFWFISIQGMEALFTLYGVNELGLSKGASAFSLTFFSLSFVLFAIPSGFLGAKYGKKRVIVAGVIGLAISFFLLNWVESVLFLRIILFVGGAFWAFVNINSYPLIVSTGSKNSIGTRTGLYYLVSSLAAISSPPILGLFIDLFGYGVLFFAATGSMLFALICMLKMKEKAMISVTTIE
ncbi:SLC45 family MFS transporter [Ferdinandcohnia quinoae]|uniref:SLC45 family MFS transporter n=1 Tax=Fredinandcohnia quinoae TaxID=2918902 RepID=A0AAW5E5B3_9BACI|nr:SLC45 family MFS transporter [Fredinandcohnia sp. SECRCQ15]MCH1626435.1 SLC45 family MFS transporter [Fredinandcohnia sp. SECRCQ15]